MELDYPAIKALSAPTRIKILHRVMEKEATPTQISNDLGKSKSTISSHLSVLVDASLVEKDEEEGRRRVTYAPTRKAQAIIEGREHTVKFSVASSVLSTAMGIGLIGSRFLPASTATADAGGGNEQASLAMDSMDSAPSAAEAAQASGFLDALLTVDNGILTVGALLLLAGIVLGSYLYMLRRWER